MSGFANASAVLVGGGRMGAIIREMLEDKGVAVLGVYDIDNIGELDEKAPAADVAIDFSAPAALPHICAYVKRTGAALVSGTTGLSAEELEQLRALGDCARVIHSANYSLGVAVLRKLAAVAAEALAGFDIEIVETHHNQKVDAPSGTAKALLAAVDPKGEMDVVHGREGVPGVRPAREIGMHALRGGTVAGTHELHFFGADEELVLTHRAASRRIFAAGAVAAAERLLMREEPGFVDFDTLMLS